MLGCVSQPQDVRANLPLVNPSFMPQHAGFPSGFIEAKAKAIPELTVTANQPLMIDGNTYAVSESYVSALGAECFRLERTGRSGSMEVRPLCHNQSHWLLYPALVFSNTL